MAKSLAKNSIFYLIYNVLNVLFPFITGIYVARVLLPDVIGQVAYAQNIASYFVIFAFLGIPTYGLREIAKVRNSYGKLSKIYSELCIINFISTIFFLSAYIVLIFSVPSFRENYPLYLITGGAIALNALNNSWLYEGLEEFSFISIRNIVFKLLSFVLLVIFVRGTEDYLIYAAVTVIGTAGNYILNVLHAKKFVKFTMHGLSFRQHMKPIFMLVAVNLAIEIYTLVDTTMLGIFCQDSNVAFYSYGSKINRILLQIVNTFTMVIVPRISYCYKENNFEEFNRLLTKTLKIIVLVAVPMIIGIQFVADFAVCAIYGDVYINSAYVLRILSGVLLISPIGYLLGSRVCLVADREKCMIISVGAGAVANVIGNLILIPQYGEYGAAIASVISEVIVMVIYIIFGHKFFRLQSFIPTMFKIIFSAGVATGYLVLCAVFIKTEWIRTIAEIIGAVVIYGVCLIITKEPLITGMLGKIKDKLTKRKKNMSAEQASETEKAAANAPLSIEEIHKGTLTVIEKFAELCDKLGVNYYVFYGSLIGAVRHNGFIPWDDDFDVAMMRNDYEKFVGYCIENREELKPFALLCLETEPKYPYAIPRFNDMRYNAVYENMIHYDSGLFIDIYPLDEIDPEKLARKKFRKKQLRYMQYLSLAYSEHFSPSKTSKIRNLLKFPAYLIAKFHGKNYYINKLEKLAKKVAKQGSGFVACSVWDDLKENKRYAIQDFLNNKEVIFENITVRIPVGYDNILSCLYGDYMTLPPIEQQKPQHQYILYKNN